MKTEACTYFSDESHNGHYILLKYILNEVVHASEYKLSPGFRAGNLQPPMTGGSLRVDVMA